jgi:uncharacterized protein
VKSPLLYQKLPLLDFCGMKGLTTVIAVSICCTSSCAAWADARGGATERCDVLAASPEDNGRPEGIKGVEYNKIDAAPAIIACTSALERDPYNSRLQFQLARSYMTSGHDLDKAFALNEKAAEAGYTNAMVNLAAALRNGWGTSKNYGEAVRWLRRAASEPNSNRMAQFALGQHYAEGQGIGLDYAEAMRWYKTAADQGLAKAITNMAYLYKMGWGVTRDIEKSNALYLKSANMGDDEAMYGLALNTLDGLGVEKNEREAIGLLQRSFDAGNGHAAYRLGLFYDQGKTVPFDAERAASYFLEALRRKDKNAKVLLIQLKGFSVKSETLNALQALLVRKGKNLAPVDGKLGPEAIDALMSELPN